MKIINLLLTCANDGEAEKISQKLLKKHLVACIKKTKINSSFLWRGKISKAVEVLLIMDSVEEKFGEIEKEVRKLHSYDTPVLVALPVSQISKGVKEWMSDEIR